MEVFLFIVYIVLAVFAMVLLSKLEKTFKEALKNIDENFYSLEVKLVETTRHLRRHDYNIQANVRQLEDLSARVYDLENPNGEEE